MTSDIVNYKRHLEGFFFYIYNNADMNEKCFEISKHSISIYDKLKTSKNDGNWSLSIDPPWLIPIINDRDFSSQRYLLVCGKIDVKQYNFTFHSLSVCVVTNNKIVRRYHFDIDTGSDTLNKAPKVKYHMQYGGDAQHELNHIPKLMYDLEPWLKIPRFPFHPIDIILLLDFTLREFNTSIGKKFIEEGSWRELVKKSEILRLKDYYFNIYKYFSSNKKLTLYEELCC